MIIASDDVREVLIKSRSAGRVKIEKMNVFLKNLINETPLFPRYIF